MGIVSRFLIAALTIVVLAPAHGDELHPATANQPVCLDQKERRAEIETGRLVELGTAMRAAKRHTPGIVVRARLCHGHDGLIYVLTVLAHDGKVAQLIVDAVKGTLVGGL